MSDIDTAAADGLKVLDPNVWTRRFFNGKAAQEIVPPRPRIPWWKGPGADSEEKHEPASNIDTALMDSLKVLDLERPIREADMRWHHRHDRFVPQYRT